jgi:UDP-N-acetyl-D-glucosamine dehydrogenase
MPKEIISVVGMGYVGLSLAESFVNSGRKVVGLDNNKGRIAEIGSSSSVRSVSIAKSDEAPSGGLVLTSDPSDLRNCNVFLIAVPTPLGADGKPDYSAVESAAELVISAIDSSTEPSLVVLESTVAPGTTRKYLLNPLSEMGFVLGRDVFICYSPERVDPGNRVWTLSNTPKVIAAFEEASLQKGLELYGSICADVVPTLDVEAAEMSKLFENTFRQVNIALVNELEGIADGKIDFWEVLRLAGTKPFGFLGFRPGAGVGGHCIPIDPLYLNDWLEESAGSSSELITSASEINSSTPIKHAKRFVQQLTEEFGSTSGVRAALVGVAFKGGVSDTRESPAFPIAEFLLSKGVVLEFVDPNVDSIRVGELEQKVMPEISSNIECAIVLHTELEEGIRESLSKLRVVYKTSQSRS